MPAYGIESRKGQSLNAKASHSNLKNLPNAVVKEAPPDPGALRGGVAAGAAGVGMGMENTGTYDYDPSAGPAVAMEEAGSITSALQGRLLDYGLEPTDLPKVSTGDRVVQAGTSGTKKKKK